MESYYEIYVKNENGVSVHDTAWNFDDAKRLADELKAFYPDYEVGVYEYKYEGTPYVATFTFERTHKEG